MKKLFIFFLILTATAGLLGVLVTQSVSASKSSLSSLDESYRERLATINSRPLGDGILGDPKTGFPFDNCYLKENDEVEGLGQYTSPTNIGLYLTYLLGIYRGEIAPFYAMSRQKALERIEKILVTLDTLPPEDKWEGLYYWMVVKDGRWVRAADGQGNYVISQPDNGNLFAGLITMLGAAEIQLPKTQDSLEKARLERIRSLSRKLILEANWKPLIDPERALYYLAFIPDTKEPLCFGADHVAGDKGAPIYVENLMDEWRLGVMIAYALSDLPGSRTAGIPLETWTQLDREKRSFDAGEGKQIEALASGHGGMFQQRLPLIFVPEDEWSDAFRDAHNNFFYIAANYAQQKKQPFILSAASNPEGKVEYIEFKDNPNYPVDTTYDEFGTTPLALKLSEEFNIITYKDKRPVGDTTTFYYASTPHALALGFLTNPVETIALFKRAELSQKVFTFPGGLPDAFGVSAGKPDKISFRSLVLDQLMLVLALQGRSFQGDFTRGLKSLGIYEKARKLYQDEEKFYPRLYPLKRERLPDLDLDTSVYLGTRQQDYGTVLKMVRLLAMESGFKILSESSEQWLANKFMSRKINKKDMREFFLGNLLALSVGENGTFKPRKSAGITRIPARGGWMGDRLPLVDVRDVKTLTLEVEPAGKDRRITFEFQGRKGEPIFGEKKTLVKVPAGKKTVTIPVPQPQSEYLAYLVAADASDDFEVKSLRLR